MKTKNRVLIAGIALLFSGSLIISCSSPKDKYVTATDLEEEFKIEKSAQQNLFIKK